MYDMGQQVLETTARWAVEGFRFAVITVVRTWGSAPRPPGSWMALREDGQVAGSVSGGCIEDDLLDKMRGGEMRSSLPYLLTYGVTQDDAPLARTGRASVWAGWDADRQRYATRNRGCDPRRDDRRQKRDVELYSSGAAALNS